MRLSSDLRLDRAHPLPPHRGLSGAYLRGGAVSVSASYADFTSGALQCKSLDSVTPLPDEFLKALTDHEEVLVTSRDGATRGTVPVWFVVAPPGVVYLFGFGFSEKARRWLTDPWVRLTVPGESTSVEGVVRFV